MTASAEAEGIAARGAALRAVLDVETRGAWSNVAVPAAVADLEDARDRAFASHLAYETVRWRGTLDHVLAQVVSRPLDQVEPDLLAVLRLGALQLLRTEVPARAAVDTAVRLARARVPPARAAGAGGFVNGVLRAVTRAHVEMPDPADDPAGSLALATAHPRWIVDELLERLGYDESLAALEADNAPPGVTLRAIGDRDELLDELRAAGIAAEAGALAPEAVRAPGADPRRLAAVLEGRARVQDEASMLVVHATGVQPGDRVLDLCAGPGGKSTHLAQLTGAEGAVVAVERDPARAEMIRAAAALSGTEVEVVVADAVDADVGDDYDVVLLDAPCSGLGVGRRRPEIRWRRTPNEVAELQQLQERLVASAADRVRVGGRLTYSVCTWTLAETVAVADALAQERPELEELQRVQWWPHVHATDGMFCATWVRGA